jgi:hypothetical protein
MLLVIGSPSAQALPRLAFALLGVALLAGCTTAPNAPGQPPLPVETEPVVRADPPEREGSPEVRFDTRPDGADLLIDNRLRGTTPLVLKGLPPGLYKIEARKPGYKTVADWVSHPGGGARYSMELHRIEGRLAISVAPNTARVTVGGVETAAGSMVPFPAGTYVVRAEAFGYLPAERSVTVEPDATAAAALALEPAPLTARLAGVDHRRFDPGDCRDAAAVRLDYAITAPASGEMRVTDDSGALVRLVPFDARTPRGTRDWDGRTDGGSPVSPGRYRIRLQFTSERGQRASLEVFAFVTPAPSGSLGADASGLSGLRYAPATQTAAPGEGAVFATTSVRLGPGDASPVESAPVAVAARYGIANGLEVGLSASTFLKSDPPLPFGVTAAAKQRLASSPPFSAAAIGRLSLQAGEGSDPLTAFTGAAAGLASALQAGACTLALAPELVVSPWRVTDDDSYDDNPELTSWAYLRGSVSAAFPGGLVGLSGALRTRPFADGGGIAWPLLTAVEGHWRPRGSRLSLSAFAAAQVGQRTIEMFLVGTGFCWLY